MNRILVKDLIPNAFSNEQALVLKDKIGDILEQENCVILDFQGISQYTTLFFNFSTGFFVKKFGKEKYDEMFKLINLSELGTSTYMHSYNNSLRTKEDIEEINKAIKDILSNVDDI